MEVKVVGFLIWAILVGMCTALIWQYLLWYVCILITSYYVGIYIGNAILPILYRSVLVSLQ